MIELEREIAQQFSLYESTIMDMTEEQYYFNAKSLYMNEYSAIKEAIQQASMIGFEAGFNELTAPFTLEITNAILNNLSNCWEMNDAWADVSVYSSIHSSRTMMALMSIIIAFSVCVALVLLVVSTIYTRKISKNQSETPNNYRY